MVLNKQKGFTLIELIMVIVVLGILAAIALPKFADMQVDARKAVLRGMLGAVRAASVIGHAEALLKSQLGATGSVTLEGATVNLVYGYPAATATGIASAMNYSPSADFTLTPVAGPPGTLTIDHAGATTPATCRITYTEATAAVPASVVETSVAGC